MTNLRTEKDSMGELQVPQDALYAAQTQRAVQNFPISGLTMPTTFIRSLGLLKQACAKSNLDLGLLEQKIADSIINSCEQVISNQVDSHFPIDVFQTGSGTSSNMNANEVIASLASNKAAKKVHPNDHVNMSQSSNDVIPTCIHLSSALLIHELLLPSLEHLNTALKSKADSLQNITKTGRTHLMDAMPVTLGQELGCFAAQIKSGIDRIKTTLPRVCSLAIGGTAVGTGINAHPEFGSKVAKELSVKTGIDFTKSTNHFESLSTQDTMVELSGQLKTVAVSLMKIANDLRWMNSGPLAGFAEITLPAIQPGSSIMPGKINPVIPEAICMLCAQVIGNDTTITIGGQAGNFQLNVMLPVIAYNIIQSIELLGNGAKVLADGAIKGFEVNKNNIEEKLSKNPILVTALNNVIGYEKGAEIAKKTYKENRAVKDVALELTDLTAKELDKLLDPFELTKGGIAKS
jgi:fumarate hydratase, class II